MLNGLDLFSGIGGLSVALSPWVRAIAYCENDRYAQAVLLSRMYDGRITTAPIWDDITTLVPELLPRSEIDIIYGGFPCQDISVAGRGRGLVGKRSRLFFEIIRLLDKTRTPFIFLENVPAIRTRGAERVGKELSSLGYDCRWKTVSAEEIGAPHVRNRWFLLAANSNSISGRLEQKRRCGQKRQKTSVSLFDGRQKQMADANSLRSEARGGSLEQTGRHSEPFDSNRWTFEPNVGRVAHGIPFRVDRVRGLGNSVVSLQARKAFKDLMGLE